MTAKDTVKIWACFRPGDVVRAKVVRSTSWDWRRPRELTFTWRWDRSRWEIRGLVSLEFRAPTVEEAADFEVAGADFLSTAANSLGVLFAVSTTTGATLEAISWEEMRDPTTGELEGRKVAGSE